MIKITDMYLIGQKLKDLMIMKDTKNGMMIKKMIKKILIGIVVNKNLTNLVNNLLLRNFKI